MSFELPLPASQPSANATAWNLWLKSLGTIVSAPIRSITSWQIISQSNPGLEKIYAMDSSRTLTLQSSALRAPEQWLKQSEAASNVSHAVSRLKFVMSKSALNFKRIYANVRHHSQSKSQSPQGGENLLEALRDSRAIYRLKALDLPELVPLESRSPGCIFLCFGKGTSGYVMKVPCLLLCSSHTTKYEYIEDWNLLHGHRTENKMTGECYFDTCSRVRDTIRRSLSWWEKCLPLYGRIHVKQIKVSIDLYRIFNS